MKQVDNFVDGLAYCEAKGIYSSKYSEDKNAPREPLVSKTGNYMINVKWSVVDSAGNTGVINDYISEKSFARLENLKKVLGVNEIFDPVTKNFNVNALKSSGMGCAIKLDSENPQYGSKIQYFVPIEFYALLANPEKVAQAVPGGHDINSNDFLASSKEDDDIPF